jgi:hypothetical protein
MADVFISYKRDDKHLVGRIVNGLRTAELSVWWDADIAPRAPWEATIEDELRKARAVVVAWSKSSITSENVKAEARGAHRDGRLVQVFLDRCDPPLFFGERQGIDLSKWSGAHEDQAFIDLVAAVRAAIRGEPMHAASAPKRPERRTWVLGLTALLVVAGLALAFGVPQASLFGSEARTLDQIEGRWGRPGCPSPQEFFVADGQITVRAPGWISTGRIVSVSEGAILSETLSPIADRGRLVELRLDGDRLVLHDRASDVRQVLERCN